MGKKKKNVRSRKSGGATAIKEEKFTAEDLLNKVDEFIDTFQYDLALKFCERAINIDSGNLRALETAGNIYAELGDCERAKIFYQQAVEKSPTKGYQKYMYLGQLSDGEESIDFYLKGIEIIQTMLQQHENNTDDNMEGTSKSEEEVQKLRRDKSNAYCSLAEVYLTDSCFTESAEIQCEKYCKAAIDSDSGNSEAYCAFANFLLSKGDTELAKDMACRSLDIWAPSSLLNGDTDVEPEDPATQKPNFESRLNLSKIFIELKEYEKAKFVLIGLLEENDEDINILYLLGLNENLDGDFTSSTFFLEKAKELIERFGCDDEEMVAQIDDLIETNKATIGDSKHNADVVDESACDGVDDLDMETEQ